MTKNTGVSTRLNRVRSPMLPRQAARLDLSNARISHGEHYLDVIISACRIESPAADGLTIESAKLKDVEMRNSRLENLQMSDVRVESCDLSNGIWHKAALDRVEFIDCRMIGFKLVEAEVSDVLIQDSNCELAQFRYTKFKSSSFESCALKGADFYSADLRRVIFRRSDMRDAELSATKLKGADLRGCKIDGVRVQANALVGTIVDNVQAAYLLGLLGLVVKEVEDSV